LNENEHLKKAINDGKIKAFADDIMIVADTIEESEFLIN
jgi:hypothetical protein